ncbi:MAG: hypothetical protein EAZ09_03920 [Oscillatoriales cyanobacterium]|nr:MAG: hypothetical protein EAZ18_05970 [Oscillatoriales cyanobacterium]TAH24440.1 MAG: hypothetical protein EAZ09_03920 [Oscillatoriales cyanobacterium]
MPYSDFSLEKVKRTFELTTSETVDLFGDVPELECSALLTEIVRYNAPLAVASNSEKARSEMIICPILIDLRRLSKERINLFSGIDFDVDSERGLNGICDFIISNSSEILFVSAPIITLVEAKKENITAGLGQCVAEMLAARIFNERAGNEVSTIYGVVTTGSIWKFMKLDASIISIDLTEYYLKDVNKILGILAMGLVSQ